MGLSKLARTVDAFARRAQIQEQMTAQIAGAVMDYLQPNTGDGCRGSRAYVHGLCGGLKKAGQPDDDI